MIEIAYVHIFVYAYFRFVGAMAELHPMEDYREAFNIALSYKQPVKVSANNNCIVWK